MMKALLRIRFRALVGMLLRTGGSKDKPSPGKSILFALLFLYVGAAALFLFGMVFYSLAQPFHLLELDWLYFAMAGIYSLAVAVLGSIFTTQNQLYEAKDNDLLLSMPIPAGKILLSRMMPLLAMNLMFCALVMLPAMVVYGIFVEFSILAALLQFLCIPAIALVAQSLGCLLGWLSHLVMSRINKSLASVLFMVVFLGAYFTVYYNAGDILNLMLQNTAAIASAISLWLWPIYAMGLGSTGQPGYALGFYGICIAVFALAYWLLSATFLHAAASTQAGNKRKKLVIHDRVASPANTILRKELLKFVSTPIYLTNMGIGILFGIAMTVAGVVLHHKLLPILLLFPDELIPLFICALVSFTIGTMSCISAPSVSLEGKNLWIMRSMPLSAKTILCAKLNTHLLLTVPVSAVCGLVLAIAYCSGPAEILLCTIVPPLMALLCGTLGMVSGLKWARFDFVSEVYPCKQSTAMAVSMFGMMGISMALAFGYFFLLADHITPVAFLFLTACILAGLSFIFYRLMTRWGVKQWNQF